MVTTPPLPAEPAAPPATDVQSRASELLKNDGPWAAYTMVCEVKQHSPDATSLRGIAEILRALIVREYLAHPKGLQAVPRLTADFLNNFDRFNLSAQEGYLVSLIDGRLDLQKLLILSPFDQFTTIFNLARLEHQKAITIPR
jgi:hypothetical protein